MPLLLLLRPVYAGCGTLESVDSSLISEINAALPEGKVMSQALVANLEQNFSLTDDFQDGVFHFTFIHEGAGYKNQFGWFVYDPSLLDESSPTIDDVLIEQGTIWENASFYNLGGDGSECMQTGHTFDLEIDDSWLGYQMGFWLNANGYSSSRDIWYTVPVLNDDSPDEHSILLLSDYTDADLLMGWEDLPRGGSSDEDFNDLLLTISATPPSLITEIAESNSIGVATDDTDSDGVPDAFDDYPDDSTLAVANTYPPDGDYFTLTFEDLYPSVGDGDYNDLVSLCQITESVTPDNTVAEISGQVLVIARGAGHEHALHLKIAGAGAGGWVVSTYDTDEVLLETRTGSSTAADLDLTLVPSSRTALPQTNTNPDDTVERGHRVTFTFTPTTALDAEELDLPPYDPYLFVVDTGYDIHQLGYAPVSGSDNPTDTFEDSNGYPWVLIFPTAWDFPIERQRIDSAYSEFTGWRTNNGSLNRSWYMAAPSPGRTRPITDSLVLELNNN